MPQDGIKIRTFGGVEYLNMTSAAKYAGYSSTGFVNLLKRLKDTPDEIEKRELPGGSRDKYVKKADLDAYLQPRKVE